MSVMFMVVRIFRKVEVTVGVVVNCRFFPQRDGEPARIDQSRCSINPPDHVWTQLLYEAFSVLLFFLRRDIFHVAGTDISKVSISPEDCRETAWPSSESS